MELIEFKELDEGAPVNKLIGIKIAVVEQSVDFFRGESNAERSEDFFELKVG